MLNVRFLQTAGCWAALASVTCCGTFLNPTICRAADEFAAADELPAIPDEYQEELPPLPGDTPAAPVDGSESDIVSDADEATVSEVSRAVEVELAADPGIFQADAEIDDMPPAPMGQAGILDVTGGDEGLKPISRVNINIAPLQGQLPTNHATPRFMQDMVELTPGRWTRQWMPRGYAWEAPGMYHQALVFEETNLERYGWHAGPLQPFVSAGNFGVNFFVLPYKLALYDHCEVKYTLGHMRPGNCVRFRYHGLPLDAKAALFQGAVVTGFIFAIP